MVDPQEFGELKGEFTALREEVRSMKASIEKLVAISENAKGSWKTLVVLGTVAGSVGTVLSKYIPWGMR